MIKNHFHFTLKAIFILKTIKFLSWLFANVGKWRNKKAKVNFKIYDVIISKKIIAIQILHKISRSKNNQTIRFGQLIVPACGAGTSFRPSSKIEIEHISASTAWKFIYSLYFIVCPSQRQPKYIKYKVISACFYLIWSIFEKGKRSGNSLLPYFLNNFSKKIFLLTDQIPLFDCLYFLRYWAIWVL